MIVAFPPGGADDATARMIQDAYGESPWPDYRDRQHRRRRRDDRRRQSRPRRAGRLYDPAASRRVGGRYGALSESDIRCREGFRPDRPHQHRIQYARGSADAAGEQFQGAVGLDEATRRKRQDRPPRRRLVRSFGRSTRIPGNGRESRPGALSRCRSSAGRSPGGSGRPRSDISRGRAATDQVRQAQRLRDFRPHSILRPAEPADV